MTEPSTPNTSVNWNGLTFTAHASRGSKFGEGTGDTAEDATAAAVMALGGSPEREAPVTGPAGSVTPDKAPKS